MSILRSQKREQQEEERIERAQYLRLSGFQGQMPLVLGASHWFCLGSSGLMPRA